MNMNDGNEVRAALLAHNITTSLAQRAVSSDSADELSQALPGLCFAR